MNAEADDIIFRLSLAADSLTYIAYGIEHESQGECEEANAVHYIAHCLKTQTARLREIVDAGL